MRIQNLWRKSEQRSDGYFAAVCDGMREDLDEGSGLQKSSLAAIPFGRFSQVILWLALLVTASSQALASGWVSFEIRSSPAMVGRSLTLADPYGNQTNPGNFDLSWDGTTASEGFSVIGGVYVYIDDTDPEQDWVFSAGGREARLAFGDLQNAINTGGPINLIFNSTGVSTVEFVEAAYYDSGLSNYLPVHGEMAVVQNSAFTQLPFNEVVTGNTLQGYSYQLFRGAATADPSLPFYVVSLSYGQRVPNGITNLAATDWTADNATTYPLRPVEFFLNPENDGYAFTLHYQSVGRPEMLQAFTASLNGDGGSVGFSSSVAAGSYFWITRDVDGWNSSGRDGLDSFGSPSPGPEHMNVFGSGMALHWETYSSPPPEILVQRTFCVPSGLFGTPGSYVGYIHQQNADRDLTYSGSSVWQDYDANGNPHFFYYDVYTANVGQSNPFWFEVYQYGEQSQGEQWFFNGWSPIGGPSEPPPPEVQGQLTITIGAERLGHNLTLSSELPSLDSWASSASTATLPDLWHEGNTWSRPIYTYQTSYSMTARTLNITDYSTPTNESWDFFLGGGNVDVDLTASPQPEVYPLELSLSRWGHDLRLRHPNGEEYAVSQGNSNGDVTLMNEGAWYNAYNYFTAYTSKKVGIPFWIFDATTGEDTAWDNPNQAEWIYTIPIEEVHATATGVTSAEVTWQLPASAPSGNLGGWFKIESRVFGSDTHTEEASEWYLCGVVSFDSAKVVGNPRSFHWAATGLSPSVLPDPLVTYQFRVSSYFSATGEAPESEWIELSWDRDGDWDGDGMPNWFEVAWNFNPFGNSDAQSDVDEDGLSNLEEYLCHRDPRSDADGEIGTVAIVSGNNQELGSGEITAQPLVVEVRRADGSPYQNVAVSFTQDSNGLFLVNDEEVPETYVLTDAVGRAEINVRMGTTGVCHVIATTGPPREHSSVTFSIWNDIGVVISPNGGTFAVGQTVTFAGSPVDAAIEKIYYTLDGSEPTEESDFVANPGDITVSHSAVVTTRAFVGGSLRGGTSVAIFKITGAVAAGSGHQLALRTDGTVWVWGFNPDGELGDGTTVGSLTPVQVMISAEQPLVDVIAISAGQVHSVALTSDGTVYTWGANAFGQLGLGHLNSCVYATPVALSNIVAISAGWYHSLALDSNGVVHSWGRGTEGQLGLGIDESASSPATVACGLSPLTKISAGGHNSFAIDTNGAVWVWGAGSHGQLGTGSETGTNVPVQVSGVSPSNLVAAGNGFSFTANHNVPKGVGFNGHGELGLGFSSGEAETSTDILTPTELATSDELVTISAGSSHALGLTADGRLLAWGGNEQRQVSASGGDNIAYPTQIQLGETAVSAIAAGYQQSVATTDDGIVWIWGRLVKREANGDVVLDMRGRPVSVDYSDPVGISLEVPGHEALPLQISLSRWGHELKVVDDQGGEFQVITETNPDDILTLNPGDWSESYFYFAASGRLTPGAGFRVLDVTTGDFAPENASDLKAWIYWESVHSVHSDPFEGVAIATTWNMEFRDLEPLLGAGFEISKKGEPAWTWQSLAVSGAINLMESDAIDDGPVQFEYQDSNLVDRKWVKYRVGYRYGPAQNGTKISNGVHFFLDSDNDGMPDFWEIENGFPPDVPAGFNHDDDGDYLSDLEEYRRGTDPHDPAPMLTVTVPSDAVLDFVETVAVYDAAGGGSGGDSDPDPDPDPETGGGNTSS